MTGSKPVPATVKDNAEFVLLSDERWILDCFDALQGCNFNYPAVFGVPYIELPVAIIEDLKRLLKRQSQLRAAQEKK